MINEKIQAEKVKPIHQDWLHAFGDVVDEFTVTGASKRGWTTWTIGAVDKRVKAMAPLVLDCLNMRAAFRSLICLSSLTAQKIFSATGGRILGAGVLLLANIITKILQNTLMIQFLTKWLMLLILIRKNLS